MKRTTYITKILPLALFASILCILLCGHFFLSQRKVNTTPTIVTKVNLGELKSALHTGSTLKKPDSLYILHIFSSWCEACSSNTKYLMKLKKSHPSVKVIGLIWQDTPKGVMSVLTKKNNPYDDIAVADDDMIVELGISNVPETFLLDKDGVVLYKIIGVLKDRELFDAISAANQ